MLINRFISHSRQDKAGEDLEEERRLCYVGITRAKDELYMTSCSMRRMYGRTEYMMPSPFLGEIVPERLKIIGHVPFGFKKSSARVKGLSGTCFCYKKSRKDVSNCRL